VTVGSPLRRFGPLLLVVAVAWAGMLLLRSWSSESLGKDIAAAAKPGDILMVSSQTCPYCEQARAWFNKHEVTFGECFIETDAACAETYRALQAPGTPTLVVRGQRQVGFSAERVAKALKAG
jgi:glutaredoxin